MFYPSSAVQNCRKHLTNCLSRKNCVGCTCGILLIHIINKDGGRMKCPITGTVCGNMGNATNHIVICYARLNNRYESAQTFKNLALLIIYKVSHSGLLAAIRPERPVTRGETTPLSANQHVHETTQRAHTLTYTCMYYNRNRVIQCSLSSSCQIATHTCVHTHTQVSLFLFSQPGAVCFSLYAGIPVCIHLFPQTGQRKTKT